VQSVIYPFKAFPRVHFSTFANSICTGSGHP
jgi:hypothetical protein